MNQTCDKDFVHVVTTPDSYRGKYRGSDEETGIEYANEIKEAIENARNKGRKVIAQCSVLSITRLATLLLPTLATY